MHTKPRTIDEVCANIINFAGLLGSRYIEYDTLRNDDRSKVEEAMIEMMAKDKLPLLNWKRRFQMIYIVDLI